MKYLCLLLSLKYLIRRRIVLLSVAAVAMSTGLLIATAGLFESFINSIQSSATQQLGDVVLNGPGSRGIPQYRKLIERLTVRPEIEAAAGGVNVQGLLLLGRGNVKPVSVWGTDFDDYDKVTGFGDTLLGGNSGNLRREGDSDIGYVGIAVLTEPDEKTDAYDMQVVENYRGRRMMLTTGTGLSDSAVTIKFKMADAFQTGIFEFDSHFVYLPVEVLNSRVYPDSPDTAHGIKIRLAEGVGTKAGIEAARQVWDRFASDTLGWTGFLATAVNIESSVEMQQRLIGEYRKQMSVLIAIFGIVSAGVVLLIFCIFYMIVITRRKDIAIIKSCGAGSSTAAMIFIIFGLIIGIAGATLGLALGALVVEYINPLEKVASSVLGIKLWKSSTYMFERIPAGMNWPATWWIITASVAASCIGSLLPALSAALVKPVKLLRYE